MKTAKLDGGGRVRVVEVPEPTPGLGEVVVQTAVSALCGSELGAYRGAGIGSGNGGHEAAGVVAEVGEGVTAVTAGDRVGVSAVAGCGSCEQCANGRYTWCDARKVYTGMHAERFVVAANACHLLPADVPWEVGVLLSGDGLGVPYHTSRKLTVPGGATVAVFGVGPIGLGNTLLHAFLGRRVIAVDLSATRLEYALQLGAELSVDAGVDDPVARIMACTNGVGVDVAIEAAGKPVSAKQCFRVVRKGGTVAFNGEQSDLQLSPSEDFIRRDITAVGSWFYHFCEFDGMLALFRAGLRVADLVSHRFPLDDAPAAFEAFAAGRTAKTVLTMG